MLLEGSSVAVAVTAAVEPGSGVVAGVVGVGVCVQFGVSVIVLGVDGICVGNISCVEVGEMRIVASNVAVAVKNSVGVAWGACSVARRGGNPESVFSISMGITWPRSPTSGFG